MASSYYGLASGLSDMQKGYDVEEERQAKKAAGAQQAEMGGLKIEQIRSEMEKEGTKVALSKALRGDVEGAMAEYNKQGEDQMSDLKVDLDTNSMAWTDGQGEQRVALIPHLMAMSGLNPKDLDTPEAGQKRDLEKIEFKAKMAKKYGIGTGGKDKRTAYIQNLEYTMKNLTNNDPRKAFELMQISKSDPQAAYAKILLDLQKQNKDKFEDAMTQEEMRKAAKDAVTSFRKDMFDDLMNPVEGGQPAPDPAAQPEQQGATGAIDRGPVTGDKSYSNLWK